MLPEAGAPAKPTMQGPTLHRGHSSSLFHLLLWFWCGNGARKPRTSTEDRGMLTKNHQGPTDLHQQELADLKICFTKRALTFPTTQSVSRKAAELRKHWNAETQQSLQELEAAQTALLLSFAAGQIFSYLIVRLLFTVAIYQLLFNSWGLEFRYVHLELSATHKAYEQGLGGSHFSLLSFCLSWWHVTRRWKEQKVYKSINIVICFSHTYPCSTWKKSSVYLLFQS